MKGHQEEIHQRKMAKATRSPLREDREGRQGRTVGKKRKLAVYVQKGNNTTKEKEARKSRRTEKEPPSVRAESHCHL